MLHEEFHYAEVVKAAVSKVDPIRSAAAVKGWVTRRSRNGGTKFLWDADRQGIKKGLTYSVGKKPKDDGSWRWSKFKDGKFTEHGAESFNTPKEAMMDASYDKQGKPGSGEYPNGTFGHKLFRSDKPDWED